MAGLFNHGKISAPTKLISPRRKLRRKSIKIMDFSNLLDDVGGLLADSCHADGISSLVKVKIPNRDVESTTLCNGYSFSNRSSLKQVNSSPH